MDHKTKVNEVYTCPMHPDIQEASPGLCSECGMSLVKSKRSDEHAHHTDHHEHDSGHENHDKHAGHSPNIFRNKFWVSFVLSIPVVLYSPLPQLLLGWTPPAFPGSTLLPLILSSIIFFYGGWIFLSSAWRELRGKAPGMMTLISLAIITAYTYSVVQVARGQENTLFWELSTLIVAMLLGHWMEMRAVQGAQGALQELSKLLPDTAEVERGESTKTVPLEKLQVGDVVKIRPGGKIPADGVVVEGASDVNEALATGEAKPVAKKKNDNVIAGTVNGNGSLRVQVAKIGDDTFLAGVMRLVREAQASKSKLQLLSDKAALYLTGIAISAGIITLLVWLPLRGVDFGLTRMVAVLVIACPHALGLAIPLVASISTTMAAKNGFLVRQRLALEAARNVDVVLFDKTGTLTTGEYGVTDVISLSDMNDTQLLEYAASVDALSEHAVAQAIVEKARSVGVQVKEAQNFKRIPGMGVMGAVNGTQVVVGGKAILEEHGIAITDQQNKQMKDIAVTGKTMIHVIVNETLQGVIALGDTIRSESREAIASLQDQGVEVAMITGDAQPVAAWVAGELGIKEFFAEVLPEHKTSKVKELQKSGKKVAMVGDGINDAPALTQADVGIAIGAGTNVAVESAGIVLVKNDPRDIPKIIQLSKLTYTKMIQNLFWATGYNAIALPLAAGAAATWGIFLNPAVSAIFMSISTVIVAINAVALRRHTLTS